MRTLIVAAIAVLIVASAVDAQWSTYAGCSVADYGNGVYYFTCTQAKFGKALSEFRRLKNPDIITIASDDSSSYGYTSGYFVVVRDQSKAP